VYPIRTDGGNIIPSRS